MTNRSRHNAEIPVIARAIQEYKTTHKTQRQCAEEFGIPYKVFSYYYLYGFKKNQKVGGTLIPEDDLQPHVRKSKLRQNNYDIVLVGGNNEQQQIQHPVQRQLPPKPVSHTVPVQQYNNQRSVSETSRNQVSNIPQRSYPQMNVKEKLNAATTIKDGGKHIDLSQFLL